MNPLFLLVGLVSTSLLGSRFGPADLVGLARISDLTPSPGGDKVLYRSSKYNPATDSTERGVFILDVETRAVLNMTAAVGPDASSFLWMGGNVMFRSNRTGSHQMWVVSLNSTKATQLTNFNLPELNGPKYDATSNKLVFSSPVDLKREKTFSSGMVFTELYARHGDSWYDYKHQHLYQATLIPNKVVTEAFDMMRSQAELECPRRPYYSSDDYTISSDGIHVAFVTMPASKDRAWKSTSQLLVYSSKDNSISVISSGLGAISNPSFSPSGDMLVWLQTYDAINEAAKKQIQILDYRVGKIYTLAQDWDNSPTSVFFSMDQTRLFLTAPDQGTTSLFSLHLSNQTRTRLTFTGTTNYITDGNNIILQRSFAHQPPEIYSLSPAGVETKISNFYQNDLASFSFGRYESFHFRGARNDIVQGFIIKPPNFQPTIKYPVVLYIHGGPEDNFGDQWELRWNYQVPAQAGYIVVGINFHGSTGFGMYFADSVRNNWSTLPFTDLMLGMDFVKSYFPFANTELAAAWGANFGGYMVNLINGKTNRFRALVTHDGIFDTRYAYYTTDELFFMESEFGGTPWSANSTYRLHNPSILIRRWKTPTLVIHGAKDYRYVDGEGLATFTALQRQSVPSKLLYFPNEGHQVTGSANLIKWYSEMLDWSNSHLNLPPLH